MQLVRSTPCCSCVACAIQLQKPECLQFLSAARPRVTVSQPSVPSVTRCQLSGSKAALCT